MEETSLVYFVGQLTDQERVLLHNLLRRAEQVGDFPSIPADEGPPWIVVAGWGEGGPAYPVTVSRSKTKIWFSRPTAEDVAEQIRAWIDANSSNEAR